MVGTPQCLMDGEERMVLSASVDCKKRVYQVVQGGGKPLRRALA